VKVLLTGSLQVSASISCKHQSDTFDILTLISFNIKNLFSNQAIWFQNVQGLSRLLSLSQVTRKKT